MPLSDPKLLKVSIYTQGIHFQTNSEKWQNSILHSCRQATDSQQVMWVIQTDVLNIQITLDDQNWKNQYALGYFEYKYINKAK